MKAIIIQYMDRSIYCQMTLSAMNYLLYMDRPGTCFILDKKYKIANSSCHFGSYGSIWRSVTKKILYGPKLLYGPGRHQKNIIWTEASEVHILFFWWRTGAYTAIWPEVTWTICYIITPENTYSEQVRIANAYITKWSIVTGVCKGCPSKQLTYKWYKTIFDSSWLPFVLYGIPVLSMLLYLFTYTGLQHDFRIIIHSCLLTVTRQVSLVECEVFIFFGTHEITPICCGGALWRSTWVHPDMLWRSTWDHPD
jgi:hypothetical protein